MVMKWIPGVFSAIMLILGFYMLVRSVLVFNGVIRSEPETELYIAVYILGFVVAVGFAFLPWLPRRNGSTV